MYESLTSEYTVGILLQCVFYIVGKTQYQLHVHVHMYCSIDACGQLQGTVPAAYVLYRLQLYQLPVLYQLRQSTYRYMYMYICTSRDPYICTCSFDKAASTKAASTKLYQLLTTGCQLLSSECQRMSANKAVSKYFWNMYQLMSAAACTRT